MLPDTTSNGAVTIIVNATNTFSTDAQTPVPYEFDQPGTYTVNKQLRANPSASGSLTAVNVVTASFEGPVIAHVYRTRFWACTNLPSGVVLDPDPRLKLTPVSDADRDLITPALPTKGINERDFKIRTKSLAPQHVLARLGTHGPILASVPIEGFRWSIAPDTYSALETAVNDDGSQVVEKLRSLLILSLLKDSLLT